MLLDPEDINVKPKQPDRTLYLAHVYTEYSVPVNVQSCLVLLDFPRWPLFVHGGKSHWEAAVWFSELSFGDMVAAITKGEVSFAKITNIYVNNRCVLGNYMAGATAFHVDRIFLSLQVDSVVPGSTTVQKPFFTLQTY